MYENMASGRLVMEAPDQVTADVAGKRCHTLATNLIAAIEGKCTYASSLVIFTRKQSI
jgi:hypothetical protein